MTEPTSQVPSGTRAARGSTSPTPRWVQLFGAVVVLLLLTFIVFHLTGNGMGGHG